MQDHLQTYPEREGARPSSSVSSQISIQFDQTSAMTPRFPVHKRNPATLPASFPETARPLLAYPQRNQTPAASNTRRITLRTKSTDQMNAVFHAHLASPPLHSSQRLPRAALPLNESRHILTTATSKPAKPDRHPELAVHNLILHLPPTTTAETIICHALARHDHLPRWDCGAQEAYRSFAEHVSERRVAAWVSRLDSLLCALYERVGGMRETRDVLEKGVRRVLEEMGNDGVDEEDGGEVGGGEREEERGGVGAGAGAIDDDDYGDVEEEMLMGL